MTFNTFGDLTLKFSSTSRSSSVESKSFVNFLWTVSLSNNTLITKKFGHKNNSDKRVSENLTI